MRTQVDSGTTLKRFAKHSVLRLCAWAVSIVIVAVWLSAAVGLAFERGVALLSAVLVVEPVAALVLLFTYDRALARAMSVQASAGGGSDPSPPGSASAGRSEQGQEPLSAAAVSPPPAVENGHGDGGRSQADRGGGGNGAWRADDSLRDATGEP